MRKSIARVAAALTVGLSVLSSGGPAAAAPAGLAGGLTLGSGAPSLEQTEQVNHRRRHRGGGGGSFSFQLDIGPGFHGPRYYAPRYYAPRYFGPPVVYYRYDPPRHYRQRGVSAHVRWCSAKYRSYRAWDNSFQPYHGGRRECVSPYY